MINWRSRDFNLKKQRRKIRLIDLPKGRPAVAPASAITTAQAVTPAPSEGG
jgi:hypothetical protein